MRKNDVLNSSMEIPMKNYTAEPRGNDVPSTFRLRSLKGNSIAVMRKNNVLNSSMEIPMRD